MCDKIYIVTDLGPGDGGKGGIIHSLAEKTGASLIIKRGGAQGSHGVRTSRGEKFSFSQWGCGTLEGIPTFLSPQMVIMPIGLYNESEALKRLGIYDPFSMISADPSCICATPYHQISSQLEELMRGSCPRGTVGTGVGQAYRLAQESSRKEITIFARDLTNYDIVYRKLKHQQKYYQELYYRFTWNMVLPEDQDLYRENLSLLFDDDYRIYIAEAFKEVSKHLVLRELSDVVKSTNGTAIVECSHGVLTDAEEGLKPHVSAIRTLPSFTEWMLRDAGYTGEISHLAVHRAYSYRHGAGPLPTYDEDFTRKLFPDVEKTYNRWQGSVRAGPLDFELLRHALDICSRHGTQFDGIALTCLDQVLDKYEPIYRVWPICNHYQYPDKLLPNPISYPSLETRFPSKIFSQIDGNMKIGLGLPLRILSLGPTESDKIYSR